MHQSQCSLDFTANIYKAHMKSARFLRFWSKQSFFSPQIGFHPKDFDDCSMWGVCDQLCEDRTGSHRCSCREGYILEQHRYCRANVLGKADVLLSPSPQKLLNISGCTNTQLSSSVVLNITMSDWLDFRLPSTFVWVAVIVFLSFWNLSQLLMENVLLDFICRFFFAIFIQLLHTTVVIFHILFICSWNPFFDIL